MKNSMVLSVIIYIMLTLPAKAFLLEPFAGYSTGSLDISADVIFGNASISDTYDLKGPTFGLRAAFEPGDFQIGAEYLVTRFTTSGGELLDDGKKLNVEEISAFLGYRFWYMRIYLAGILRAKDKDSDLDGSGLKAGLSFYPFKNMAVNIDYRTVEMNGILESVMMDVDYSATTLSVSFPFSL